MASGFHGQPGHKHEKEQITQPSHIGQENTAAMKKARQSDSNGLGNIGERRGDYRAERPLLPCPLMRTAALPMFSRQRSDDSRWSCRYSELNSGQAPAESLSTGCRSFRCRYPHPRNCFSPDLALQKYSRFHSHPGYRNPFPPHPAGRNPLDGSEHGLYGSWQFSPAYGWIAGKQPT